MPRPFSIRRSLLLTLIPVLAAAVVLGYLAWSQRTYRLGFPLDDAWIHQTYARNLAQRGEWAFLPGRPSAGSTSPLWTILLAVGHALHMDPRAWAYLLGTAALAATALAAMHWTRRRTEHLPWVAAAAAVTVVLEWHLVWSAASGMETLLLGGLALLVFSAMEGGSSNPFRLGALIGAGLWIRPDALLLLGAGLWQAWTRPARTWSTAFRGTMGLTSGMACAFVPYILFLRLIGGEWWPSTFYAKQAEYSALTQAPFLQRAVDLVRAPLAGAGGLLLLGLLVEGIRLARTRRWYSLAPHVWMAAYVGAYALRLPVSYQHGRYLMPLLPPLIVLGWFGLAPWLEAGVGRMRWIAGRAWVGAVAVVLVLFLALGGRAYAQDVAIIESEMVDTARWVADHTPPEAKVAAHDIGALGYFGGRTLIDLAGLTDPELIPILRDEAALAKVMEARRVDYLVTFPGWYPALSSCGDPIYVSHGAFSPGAGGENMVVYRWTPASFAARPTCMLYSP